VPRKKEKNTGGPPVFFSFFRGTGGPPVSEIAPHSKHFSANPHFSPRVLIHTIAPNVERSDATPAGGRRLESDVVTLRRRRKS
jgi:hypothetical protein